VLNFLQIFCPLLPLGGHIELEGLNEFSRPARPFPGRAAAAGDNFSFSL